MFNGERSAIFYRLISSNCPIRAGRVEIQAPDNVLVFQSMNQLNENTVEARIEISWPFLENPFFSGSAAYFVYVGPTLTDETTIYDGLTVSECTHQ